MTDKYILDGHTVVPCNDMTKWGRWFENAGSKRRVAEDTLGGVRVSTVFLGLDHQYGKGPPLLFETMAFGGPFDQSQTRCSTWEEAEAMHAAMLDLVDSPLGE